MAQPTPSDVHVDSNLTDFSIAYVLEQDTFIANKVAVVKPVEHKTNVYPIFNKNDWMRDDAVKQRAPGEGAPRSGWTLSSDSYNAEAWWTAVPLSELVTANADPAIPVDRVATQLVTQRMLIRRERLWASKFMLATAWDNTINAATGGFTPWDDYGSDPQKDMDTAKKAIWQSTGFSANSLTVSYSVHLALKRHPAIKDQIKYTSSDSVTADVIARYFEIDNYNVIMAVYASNIEGAVSPIYTGVNATDALLTYTNGAPGIMTPTASVTFAWSRLTGVNDLGIAIDQYYDADTKEDVVRGQFAFDMKVTGRDLGYYFQNAATA
jgi:uncharacterized membrane protein